MGIETFAGATLIIVAAALGGHSLADRNWIEGGLLIGSSALMFTAYNMGW
jgi:hypothetical protein